MRKKLSCKFVRINSSNAKKGYDTDYEVSKIQTFISKFEDRQLKKQKKNQTKKIKEKENKIKELEDEIKLETLINKLKCLKWIVKNVLTNYRQ